MSRSRIISVAAILITGLFACNIAAQERQERLSSTGFALEVKYYEGALLSYQAVYPANKKSYWQCCGRFARIASWQPPPGSVPVSAVKIASFVEGNAVRINVSALLGEFLDKEQPVATYLARENEKIVIRELAQVGIVPFEITVVRVKPNNTGAPPTIVNKTKSMVDVGLEPVDFTFPAYKLSLQNVSSKNIVAFQLLLIGGGRVRGVMMPQARQKRPLIVPGGVYATLITSGSPGQMTPEGYAPDAPQSVVISSVIFEDGTYEGAALPAAEFRAVATGNKIQLARVLALLQSVADARDQDAAASVLKLKSQVSLLKDEADTSALNELLADFPTLEQTAKENLKGSLRFGLHEAKQAVLDDIKAFESARAQSPATTNFQTWLSDTKEKYEEWLARLQSISGR